MKENIHPEYKIGNITCSCGHSFQVHGTMGDQRIEICSECHPFYTGKQKLVDTMPLLYVIQKEKYMLINMILFQLLKNQSYGPSRFLEEWLVYLKQ